MTDLQVGLLVLGAAAVAGVLLYNRMQERAVRREAERAFGGERHSDVLLGEAGAAPGPALQGPSAARNAVPAGAMPDERLDYIVVLRIAVGIPAAALLEAWRPIEQRFGQRVLLAGSDGSGWRRVEQGVFGSFSAVRAALQRVSRAGVVGEAELLEFRAEVETLASRIRAEAEAPDMREALESARALDRLCTETDIQVALHVVREGLDDEALDAATREIPDAPYQVTRRSDGLTLLLDMPRTHEVVRSYEAMARMATQLASALEGRVVDDRGADLDERALAAIGTQLEEVRRQLAHGGIEPGSALALRLFS